jgi:hypothetical protein
VELTTVNNKIRQRSQDPLTLETPLQWRMKLWMQKLGGWNWKGWSGSSWKCLTIPEPNVKVGPVNNVLSSFFESLEIRINDKQITESGRYRKSYNYCHQNLKKNTTANIQSDTDNILIDYHRVAICLTPKKIQSGNCNCNWSKKLQSENLARNACNADQWPHPKGQSGTYYCE